MEPVNYDCYLRPTTELVASAVFHTEQIEEHLYAVHATDVLPAKDMLVAGFNGKGSLKFNFRATLYFALGEMVRPVEGVMSWEHCLYAVLTPLGEIAAQCINLNTYDTIILGNFHFTDQTILILPENIAYDGDRAQIVRYNPREKSLRQAVDEVIASKQGWKVDMDEEDIEDALKPAYWNGININTEPFFQPLVQKYPHAAVGLRFDQLHGMAWRFARVEQNLLLYLMSFVKEYDIPPFTRESLQYLRDEIRDNLSQCQEWVEKMPLKESAKADFAFKVEEIEKCLLVLNEEIIKL